MFAISLSFRTFRRARTKLPALYEYDFVEADHDAKRAAHYDELLVRAGRQPAGRIAIVSVTDLKLAPTSAPLPKNQAACESSNLHEKQ